METVNISSLCILAIDDEPSILSAVKFCLRSTGWKLLTAQKAKEGLELAITAKPDVVLCDVMMPELSGEQLLKELKDNPATAGIPVVLMTGLSDTQALSKMPGTTLLAKPFGPKEVQAAIESAVAGRNGGR